jgi:four helix bundle protein
MISECGLLILNVNAQELKERTKEFALRVMRLVDALPKTPKGRAIVSQLVRSGTSVAANYRAACRGRSKAEFISKLGVAEQEADETALWLELIIADRLLPEKKVDSLSREANELTAILAASYISASRAQQTMSRNWQSEIRSQKSAIRT